MSMTKKDVAQMRAEHGEIVERVRRVLARKHAVFEANDLILWVACLGYIENRTALMAFVGASERLGLSADDIAHVLLDDAKGAST